MVVDSITTPVQAVIDTIPEAIIKPFLSQSRCRTAQSDDAESNHYCFFH
jgi:hypothetical protein